MGLFGGLLEAAGGVVGGILTEKDRKNARGEYDQAVNDLMTSNPEAGVTEYDKIKSDPMLRAAQMDALARMQKEGAAGGLTVEDRSALIAAQNANAAKERGAREAILQDAARRGMGGSGTELAAELENQQGAADRNAAVGTQAAADARKRALAAISESGQMAGAVRGQDWGEASQRAAAQDAINKFNASQRLQRAGMVGNIRIGKAGQYDKQAAATMGMARGAGAAVGGVADLATGGFLVPSGNGGGAFGG